MVKKKESHIYTQECLGFSFGGVLVKSLVMVFSYPKAKPNQTETLKFESEPNLTITKRLVPVWFNGFQIQEKY